ncbi:type II toxin-antitoxin system RelE/ParE family toxin [Marinobacter gelidimuriae]|uniref:type II toxin-antitoxin system RelE/ParE family toxin n=1 Tax=Marinobacter gelidimuriae TaxID=2739064 RepID=UPI002265C094|nr:type II toxin-antitoxin system RelE/ParE family toxin [Marinobacter gelidimuriae]
MLNFGALKADIYTDDLDRTFQLLSGSPLMGCECPEIAVSVRRHDHQKHAIFYRQREHDILVIRILHQRMDIWRHLFEF